jgi:hypothetical protein
MSTQVEFNAGVNDTGSGLPSPSGMPLSPDGWRLIYDGLQRLEAKMADIDRRLLVIETTQKLTEKHGETNRQGVQVWVTLVITVITAVVVGIISAVAQSFISGGGGSK